MEQVPRSLRVIERLFPGFYVGEDQIKALAPRAAKNCVLFLWVTQPMLAAGLEVMKAWEFEYKSTCIWAKGRTATGHSFRNKHEQLLVGVKGEIPAPGEQFDSLIEAPKGPHSGKPAFFAEMITEYFPDDAEARNVLPRQQGRPRDRAGPPHLARSHRLDNVGQRGRVTVSRRSQRRPVAQATGRREAAGNCGTERLQGLGQVRPPLARATLPTAA